MTRARKTLSCGGQVALRTPTGRIEAPDQHCDPHRLSTLRTGGG
jgi:hypothetical protein